MYYLYCWLCFPCWLCFLHFHRFHRFHRFRSSLCFLHRYNYLCQFVSFFRNDDIHIFFDFFAFLHMLHPMPLAISKTTYAMSMMQYHLMHRHTLHQFLILFYELLNLLYFLLDLYLYFHFLRLHRLVNMLYVHLMTILLIVSLILILISKFVALYLHLLFCYFQLFEI